MDAAQEIKEMLEALERSTTVEQPTGENQQADNTPEEATEPNQHGADDQDREEPTLEQQTPEQPTEEAKTEESHSPSAEKKEEGEDYASIIASLRNEIVELKKSIFEKQSKEGPQLAAAAEKPIEEKDFVGDLDFESLYSNPKELNKVLNKIYRDAIEEVRRTRAELSTVLPEKVTATIEAQRKLKELTDNFYKTNEDLRPFSKVVGVVFEELASQNPDKPVSKVLEMVGEETRKRLNIPIKKPSSQAKASDTAEGPPPLPRKRGGGRVTQTKPEVSPITLEIEEMNRALGIK